MLREKPTRVIIFCKRCGAELGREHLYEKDVQSGVETAVYVALCETCAKTRIAETLRREIEKHKQRRQHVDQKTREHVSELRRFIALLSPMSLSSEEKTENG